MKVIKTAEVVYRDGKIYYMLTKEKLENRHAYSIIIAERSEARTLFDIASTRAAALRLFERFFRGGVTVSEALYVFDDVSAETQTI